jgi:cysteine desulfurase
MDNIYLDHASSMPIEPRVLEFARKYLDQEIGNPSALHSSGLEAKQGIEDARVKIAELINADSENTIIFTGSATEANNIAIRGTALRNIGKGKEVVASAIEHISVINPMKDLQKNGFTFTKVPVDSTGLIDLEKLKELVTKSTTVTSVMSANSEIGTMEPIKDVSEIVHDQGLFLHVDATAAAGRIPINVQKYNIDLLSLSSNDLYGPQGVGALYIKKGVKLQPVVFGGGQERGWRSGTENVFGIAGMGEAARLAKADMVQESQRLTEVRDKLIDEILEIDESFLTGHRTLRLPHHASFRFSHIEGESIQLNMNMYNIQIATGSACSSKTLEGSLVMTLGKSNSLEQVPTVVKAVTDTVERLRKLSPLALNKG